MAELPERGSEEPCEWYGLEAMGNAAAQVLEDKLALARAVLEASGKSRATGTAWRSPTSCTWSPMTPGVYLLEPWDGTPCFAFVTWGADQQE